MRNLNVQSTVPTTTGASKLALATPAPELLNAKKASGTGMKEWAICPLFPVEFGKPRKIEASLFLLFSEEID